MNTGADAHAGAVLPAVAANTAVAPPVQMSLVDYASFVQSRPAPAQIIIVDAAVPNYQELIRSSLANYGSGLEAQALASDLADHPAVEAEKTGALSAQSEALPAALTQTSDEQEGQGPQIQVSRFGDVEVVVIDSRFDGIEQVTDILSPHHGLAAVQILSHGATGSLRLGSSVFNADKLEQQKTRVSGWGAALRPEGDILLYGCDVAAGSVGLSFVDNLAGITGTDVAASTNATGSAARAGDWTLEYSTGAIDSTPSFQGAAYDALFGGSVSSVGSTLTFTGSSGADTLHLRVNGSGQLEYQWDDVGGFTTLGFALSTGTINVDLGSADDAFFFDDASSLSAVELSILGGAGTDSVTLGEDFTLSGGLSVGAESITLSAGFTVTTGTGNIAFTASALDATQVTDATQLAARAASIQVLGNLVATSGNITLAAEVVRDVAVSNLLLPLSLSSTSSATVALSGTVTATAGTLSLSAQTRGTVSGTAALVAIGASNSFTETANANISNSSSINVNGLQVTALSSTDYSATGRAALNQITGDTKAYVEGSSLTVGAGGVSITATDDSTLSAESLSEAFDILGLNAPVDISVAAARNYTTRDVQAYATNTTATVTGGDFSVAAQRDVTLEAKARASAISSSVLPLSNGALSIGGTYSQNTVLGDVYAYVSGSTVTTTGAASDLSVAASDTSVINATSEGSAVAGPSVPDLGGTADAAGASIAFNTIGWSTNAGYQTVDALIGTAIGTEQAQDVKAYIVNSTVTAGGNISVSAKSDAQLNATVSNAASSTSSSLYGASSSATSGILASNMVSSNAQAYIEDAAGTRTRSVIATGAISISAEDHAGIYANSKVVSSSITSSDGSALIQGITNFVLPSDYSSSDGSVSIEFGKRVKLASNFIVADFESDQGGTSNVATNNVVRLADDYGVDDFTTDSGKRLLEAGDNVLIADDYDALLGEIGGVYQYLGARGRLELGVQDYTDATKWQRITGEAGSAYRYIGAGTLSNANLDAQDYADTTKWAKLAGTPGAVYQYMGTTQALNLGTQDYGDLGLWKPVLGTQLVPQGNNISDSNAMALGGLVVRNDVRSDVDAHILNATVTGGSVTLSALEDAVIRAVADSSAEASGGSAYGSGSTLAVNATIATNLILSQADAYIEGSSVTSTTTGDIVLDAQNTSQIDARTLSSTSSGGEAVGVVLAFNTIGWQSQNVLYNTLDALVGSSIGSEQAATVTATIKNATIKAGGDLTLSAISEAQLNATVGNEATSAAQGVINAAGAAGSGVLASNMVSSTAQAWIDTSLTGSITVGGALSLTADDKAGIDASAKLVANSSAQSDGGVSIVNNILNQLLDEYQYTSQSGTQNVKFGDRVRVDDAYAGGGEAGKVYQYMGTSTSGTGLDLGTQDYSVYGFWKELSASNLIPEGIADALLDSSAMAIGGLVVRNDVRSDVAAYLTNVTVRGSATDLTVGAGSISITALEQAAIAADIDSAVEASGGWSVNGIIATNLVLSKANAYITNSDVRTTTATGGTGDIVLDAQNISNIDATLSSGSTSGDQAVGVTLAFNTIGWQSQNVLFDAIDALLGSSIGSEQPAEVQAYILDSTVVAGNDLSLSALSDAQLVAVVDSQAAGGGMSASGVLASNMVSSLAKAWINDTAGAAGTVTVAGDLTLRADDTAGVDAQSTLLSASSAGDAIDVVGLAKTLLERLDDYKYTSKSGAVSLTGLSAPASNYLSSAGSTALVKGNQVKIAAANAAALGVDANAVYRYLGAAGTVNLSTTDYTDLSKWRRVSAGLPDLVRVDASHAGGGDVGSVYRWKLGTTANVNLGTENYADTTRWEKITQSTANYIPEIGNLTSTPSTGVGGLVVRNAVKSDVAAYINHATVNAGSVTLTALENAVIQAYAESTAEASGGSTFGGDTVLAVNAVIANNTVLSKANAYLTNDTVTTTGNVTLEAQNTSAIDATVKSASKSGGQAVGVTLAFNSIGWAPTNLLFASLDALIGTDLGTETPAQVQAYIKDTGVGAGGTVSLAAKSDAQLNATVTNAADSAASGLSGAAGSATSAVLASNMVSSTAKAYIEDLATARTRTVTAGGAITVAAEDNAGIYANSKIVSSSITTSDGGASLLQGVV
ncbi:MAG: DUF4347 domain-containing protein, partial [Sulfuritalea sp.]|nr:DUF4347 domain-containing protein [Sulfuritalea sp.]